MPSRVFEFLRKNLGENPRFVKLISGFRVILLHENSKTRDSVPENPRFVPAKISGFRVNNLGFSSFRLKFTQELDICTANLGFSCKKIRENPRFVKLISGFRLNIYAKTRELFFESRLFVLIPSISICLAQLKTF